MAQDTADEPASQLAQADLALRASQQLAGAHVKALCGVIDAMAKEPTPARIHAAHDQ